MNGITIGCVLALAASANAQGFLGNSCRKPSGVIGSMCGRSNRNVAAPPIPGYSEAAALPFGSAGISYGNPYQRIQLAPANGEGIGISGLVNQVRFQQPVEVATLAPVLERAPQGFASVGTWQEGETYIDQASGLSFTWTANGWVLTPGQGFSSARRLLGARPSLADAEAAADSPTVEPAVMATTSVGAPAVMATTSVTSVTPAVTTTTNVVTRAETMSAPASLAQLIRNPVTQTAAWWQSDSTATSARSRVLDQWIDEQIRTKGGTKVNGLYVPPRTAVARNYNGWSSDRTWTAKKTNWDGNFGTGCSCDQACTDFGDCCADFVALCRFTQQQVVTAPTAPAQPIIVTPPVTIPTIPVTAAPTLAPTPAPTPAPTATPQIVINQPQGFAFADDNTFVINVDNGPLGFSDTQDDAFVISLPQTTPTTAPLAPTAAPIVFSSPIVGDSRPIVTLTPGASRTGRGDSVRP